MADIFIDGFDKYGPATTISNTVAAALTQGEWTSTSANFAIVQGLSSTGYALKLNGGGNATKTFGSNFTRLIGGVRFANALTATAGVQFGDAGTAQCSITFDTAGTITLRTGGTGGTSVASGATVSANSTHYLEWDITFGASASYQVWLDGVSLFSGTGNTKSSANSYANQFLLVAAIGAPAVTFDDLYLFDSTGGTNNAVLNTNPRIETQFPTGDSSVQFSVGAAVLGSAYQGVNTSSSIGAGSLVLRGYTTPALTTTLNSVATVPLDTHPTAKFKACLYSDSGGPSTLLATGTEVVGCTNGTTLVLPFSSGQTLSSSTTYWIGFINDTALNVETSDAGLLGRGKTNTYASGPPNPASSGGALTVGQNSYLIWGNLTSTGANWFETDLNPPVGDLSYVFDSTVSHEDLYSFPALTTTPTNIYTMAVKGNIRRSDSGTRTVDLRTKSSSTDSGGSSTGQTPATTYGWLDSFFDTDPNTSAAWTASGLNAATSGVKVAS